MFIKVKVSLSTRTCRMAADAVREHRRLIGSRWRRIKPGVQARYALAYLRTNTSLAHLAAGARVSVSTMWRYVQEVIVLLAARSPNLSTVLDGVERLALVCLDGTFASSWATHRREFYSGRHHRYGVNIQVLADRWGQLLWVSPVLPGSTPDLTAARQHGIIDALAERDMTCLTDRGYIGAGGTVVHGRKNYRKRTLTDQERARNKNIARLRAPAERANATLKTWRILHCYRGSHHLLTSILQAILTCEYTR